MEVNLQEKETTVHIHIMCVTKINTVADVSNQ